MINDYTDAQVWTHDSDPANDARVLPMPAILDSGAAVSLHLLLEQDTSRPVVLDASGLRELCAVGTLLLASALRSRSRDGARARITNLSHAMRRELHRHPLLAFANGVSNSPLLHLAPQPVCGA